MAAGAVPTEHTLSTDDEHVNSAPHDLLALHKAALPYKTGEAVASSDDPAEAVRQRAFKGLLNKLTPDNFDRLLPKMLEVDIPEPKTLVGLVHQLLDRALSEPLYCELYSQLCHALHQHPLPQFENPGTPAGTPPVKRHKIYFRRLLLSSCQEAFEKGWAVMTAVAQRDNQAVAGGIGGASSGVGDCGSPAVDCGDDSGGRAADPPVKGGIPEAPPAAGLCAQGALLLKQLREAEDAQQAAELKARRSMLGSMQLFRCLHSYGMVADRSVHRLISVFVKGIHQNRVPEDTECLCNLLGALGQQLETPKPKHSMGKSHNEQLEEATKLMDHHISCLKWLTQSLALSSRQRFMLLDVVDLRARGWQGRKEQEGPRTIEDLHRQAKEEAVDMARLRITTYSDGPPDNPAPATAAPRVSFAGLLAAAKTAARAAAAQQGSTTFIPSVACQANVVVEALLLRPWLAKDVQVADAAQLANALQGSLADAVALVDAALLRHGSDPTQLAKHLLLAALDEWRVPGEVRLKQLTQLLEAPALVAHGLDAAAVANGVLGAMDELQYRVEDNPLAAHLLARVAAGCVGSALGAQELGRVMQASVTVQH